MLSEIMNKMVTFYTIQFILKCYTYTFGVCTGFWVVLFPVGAGVVKPAVQTNILGDIFKEKKNTYNK